MSALRQGGALLESEFLLSGGSIFYYLPPRLNKEGVLPMEYLVILALLLVLATGYIEAAKK